jgi:hypothetical protein
MEEFSFLTLLKYVLKKWLIIGLCVVLGTLAMSAYVLVAMPLTKELYKMEMTIIYSASRSNDTDATIGDSPLQTVYSYFQGSEYKNTIYESVKGSIFPEEQDAGAKYKLFASTFKVALNNRRLDLFALDCTEKDAQTILSTAVKVADEKVTAFGTLFEAADENINLSIMSEGRLMSLDEDEVAGIKVDGLVTTADRVNRVAVGAVMGFILSVGGILAVYFFNNKINSANRLECMGVRVLTAARRVEEAYTETAAKMEYNAPPAPYPPDGEAAVPVKSPKAAPAGGGKAYAFVAPAGSGAALAVRDGVKRALEARGFTAAVPNRDGDDKAFRAALSQCRNGADYTLVDVPAAGDFDYLRAAALSDGVIICVNGASDGLRALKKTLSAIRGTSAVIAGGVVLNPPADFVA